MKETANILLIVLKEQIETNLCRKELCYSQIKRLEESLLACDGEIRGLQAVAKQVFGSEINTDYINYTRNV